MSTSAIDLYTGLPLKAEDDVYHMIIEIPKHSRIKYEFSEKYNTIMVDRLFRTPISYPQNYGFFPQSWNRFDNDPPDVIVVSTESFHPGVIVPVRVIGIIELEDMGEMDHKVIAVPTGASDHAHCADIRDLDPEIVENLKWFLMHYKYRDINDTLKVLGVRGKRTAVQFLDDCHKEFKKKMAKIDDEKKVEKRDKEREKQLHMHRGNLGKEEESYWTKAERRLGERRREMRRESELRAKKIAKKEKSAREKREKKK
ncbi:MAG: inorganic diphosphatase [Magnetococcales bacterium]|nr:inorganic diphosphatase [Magnetococcales bacterium]